MRRTPTTLRKLTETEARLKAEADALAKKRAQLARQREKLERNAQEARWMAAGQVVEQAGLPIEDLDELQRLINPLGKGSIPMPPKQPMSTTANVPFAVTPLEPE